MLKFNQTTKSSRNYRKKQLERSSCSNSKGLPTSKSRNKKHNNNQQIQEWSQVINDIDKLTNKIKSLSRSSSVNKTQKKNITRKQQKKNQLNASVKVRTQADQRDPDPELKYQLFLENGEDKFWVKKLMKGRFDQQKEHAVNIEKLDQNNNRCSSKCMKQKCSPNCHEIMREIYELKMHNERLTIENGQLEKKLYLGEIQKKQLKRKIQKSHVEKIIRQHKSAKKQSKSSRKKKNHYDAYQPEQPVIIQRYQEKKDKVEFSNQDQFYKSIHLRPNTSDITMNKQQFSTQAPSLSLKTTEFSQKIDRKVIDLSEKKPDKSGIFYEDRALQNSIQKNIDISPYFRNSKNEEKLQNLQQYFDELMQVSRLQRNMIKKKAIWKQMKETASKIKQLKDFSNQY